MSEQNPHVCGAKTRSGGTCKRAPMTNGRCNLHGGKTPNGIALPQTKTGRYSKYLPTELLDNYQAALADSELLSVRDEIALVDAKIGQILALPKEQLKDLEAFTNVYDLIEQRRRLVETERKRLVDMQQMITTEQAMLLVGALIGIIKARVHDRDTLAAIQSDVNGLLARQAGVRTSTE